MSKLGIWMQLTVVWLVLILSSLVHAAYVNNLDGTVSDTTTGLMWQQEDAQNDGGGYSWEDALAYCDGLSLGGHNDWRLPNFRELASLVDYTRFDPAIDPIFQCRSKPYHTSTTSANYAFGTRFVSFHSGISIGLSVKPGLLYVRCVRGGPGFLPKVSVKAPNLRVFEHGTNEGRFVISRTLDTDTPLTVYYRLEGTAKNGIDYRTLSGKLTIPVGQRCASVNVVPIDDRIKERMETVRLIILEDSFYEVGSPASSTVHIVDGLIFR